MDARLVSTAAYRLLDANGEIFVSASPGLFGGNRRLRIYGRLDCPSARRALARGYAQRRVFFADEPTAIAAGYRPCARCMPAEYQRWKAATKVSDRGRAPCAPAARRSSSTPRPS